MLKFYLKIIADNKILNALKNKCDRIGYWRTKDPPYLIQAKLRADQVISNLLKTDVNPCFQIEVNDQVNRIKTCCSTTTKSAIYSNLCFLIK